VITAVKVASAAEVAGLLAGDLIVSIDGTELTGKGVPEVKRALMVIKGTVTVVVTRSADTTLPLRTPIAATATNAPASVDDRGLTSSITNGPAMQRLLDAENAATASATPTVPAPRDEPSASDRGLACADTHKPGPSEANLLRKLTENSGRTAVPAPRAFAPTDSVMRMEERGVSSAPVNSGHSAAQDQSSRPSADAAENPPGVIAPEPTAPVDPEKAAAVSGLRTSLAGLMRGVKLVPGQKEVVLKTRICGICTQVINAGTFLQHDGECFHPDCFVCGGCSQPLAAQFVIDDGGVRKCAACNAKDAGVCSGCGKSVWDEDPMKRLEILYLDEACYHPPCYTCIVCNESLMVRGAFRVGGQLYCRAHNSEAAPTPKKKGLTKMDRLMAAMEEQ
jgi:hypothetical protein